MRRYNLRSKLLPRAFLPHPWESAWHMPPNSTFHKWLLSSCGLLLKGSPWKNLLSNPLFPNVDTLVLFHCPFSYFLQVFKVNAIICELLFYHFIVLIAFFFLLSLDLWRKLPPHLQPVADFLHSGPWHHIIQCPRFSIAFSLNDQWVCNLVSKYNYLWYVHNLHPLLFTLYLLWGIMFKMYFHFIYYVCKQSFKYICWIKYKMFDGDVFIETFLTTWRNLQNQKQANIFL